jgi:UDP-glucose 4-epimerase
MRMLITGATGFIGRKLVSRLVQAGESVAILARERDPSLQPGWPPEIARLRPEIEVVYADLRNYPLTARAIRQARPDRVVHLAGAGVSQPFLPLETALRHNLYGTLHLMRACFNQDEPPVQQLLVGRTPGERTAMNHYAASKAAAWQLCRMYARTQGWPVNGAMIFQCYGPGQPQHNLIPAALAAARAGEAFAMTSGRAARDWIHVVDVAAGLQAAATGSLEPGATVELGTGCLTTVADVVRQIFDLVGGKGQPVVGALPDRPGEELLQAADARETTRLIGWQTTISLAEGLRRLVAQSEL